MDNKLAVQYVDGLGLTRAQLMDGAKQGMSLAPPELVDSVDPEAVQRMVKRIGSEGYDQIIAHLVRLVGELFTDEQLGILLKIQADHPWLMEAGATVQTEMSKIYMKIGNKIGKEEMGDDF